MMNNHDIDPKTYTRRNSHRLPSYDYRSSGAYFITICTQDRQRVLEIPAMHMALLKTWQTLPQRFSKVRLDEFVSMPDHIHGILWLDGTLKGSSALGRVVGAFKSLLTVAWRDHHKSLGIQCQVHLWQRDYYEHVIRDEEDLHLTRQYILNNPLEALLQQEQRYEASKKARMLR